MNRASRSPRKPARRSAQRGMTLVEIMIVLAIIAMVMGMVGFAAFPMLQKANCKGAWAQAQTISQAVSTFQTDNSGDCPKSLDDLVSGKYLSKPPVDPWNPPFKFRCPGDKNTDGADVWSSGKNKQDGDDDDVRGWLRSADEACKVK